MTKLEKKLKVGAYFEFIYKYSSGEKARFAGIVNSYGMRYLTIQDWQSTHPFSKLKKRYKTLKNKIRFEIERVELL